MKTTREWPVGFENGRGLGTREEEMRAVTLPLLVSIPLLSLNSGGQDRVHISGSVMGVGGLGTQRTAGAREGGIQPPTYTMSS